jgi:ATP-dependent Clp protease protease subunit
MGSLLLAAGTPGYRYSFPNSRMMIEQPKATFSANSEDMNIKNKELMLSRQKMHEIYSKHSGKNISYIDEADKKDLYLGPQEALDFGLVDQVISSRKSLQ